MGIVDAVCQHIEVYIPDKDLPNGICGKVIRWQAGDPMRCIEHGGVGYRPTKQREIDSGVYLPINPEED